MKKNGVQLYPLNIHKGVFCLMLKVKEGNLEVLLLKLVYQSTNMTCTKHSYNTLTLGSI